MKLEDLVNYLLFVVPGFIALEVYRAKYPAKKDSDFSRLGWSIAYSVGLIGFVRWVCHLLGSTLFEGVSQTPNYRVIFWLFVLAIFVGLVRIVVHMGQFALATNYSWLDFLHPDPLSIWALVNDDVTQEWAEVILKNGVRYLGRVKSWSFDPDETEHDFLLAEASCVDDSRNTLYKIEGRGLYLRTDVVDRIEFWTGN